MKFFYFSEILEMIETNANSMLANGEFEGDAYSALYNRFYFLLQDLSFYLERVLDTFTTNEDLMAFLLRTGYCSKSEIEDLWNENITEIQIHVQNKFFQALDEKYDGIMI